MKNTKRVLAMVFVLVFLFTAVMSSAVLAAADNGNGKGNGKSLTEETEKVKENGKDKVERTVTEETEEEKAVKEKDKVMKQKKVLMKQLIEARKTGNTEAEAQLLTQLKEYKEQLKLMVRNSYTEEEMAQLEQAGEDIETTDPTLEVLPVEKIIAKGRSLKFDIPPVIKDGKVLIPVRAFSQAYGAEVQYDSETHTITILKDGVKIEFAAGSSIVYVDGVETDLGLPVKNINGRTVMPVGFLAEKLGLKSEVDPEDGTIEIEDEEEEEEEEEDGEEDETSEN